MTNESRQDGTLTTRPPYLKSPPKSGEIRKNPDKSGRVLENSDNFKPILTRSDESESRQV